MAQAMEGSCLHDLMFFVLNDSECHSTCGDDWGCGCETHPVEDSSELTVEVDGLGSVRKGPVGMKLHRELFPAAAVAGIAPWYVAD